MKLYLICHLKICARPAPQGAGGLKFIGRRSILCRGSPAPQGAGGLKYPDWENGKAYAGPAPQGAGGLKYQNPFYQKS